MKKFLTLLLTMSLMLSITACGGKGKETGSDDANVQTKVETSDKKDDEVKMPETEDGEVEIKNEEAATKGEDKTEISSNSSETTKPNTPVQSSKPTSSEHKHSYTSAVTKAATCSAAGTKTFTCSCGDSYTEKIAATGSHVWGQWKTIKEPTTTAQGTSQRKCNNCSATENQNIDKLCHYFYNDSLEGRWSASAITVVPKEVYFENGKASKFIIVFEFEKEDNAKAIKERLEERDSMKNSKIEIDGSKVTVEISAEDFFKEEGLEFNDEKASKDGIKQIFNDNGFTIDEE